MQYINNSIGSKSLYEKLIGGSKFRQNGYINKEIKENLPETGVKLSEQNTVSNAVMFGNIDRRSRFYKGHNFWIISVTLNSIFQDTPSTMQLFGSNTDV